MAKRMFIAARELGLSGSGPSRSAPSWGPGGPLRGWLTTGLSTPVVALGSPCGFEPTPSPDLLHLPLKGVGWESTSCQEDLAFMPLTTDGATGVRCWLPAVGFEMLTLCRLAQRAVFSKQRRRRKLRRIKDSPA